VTHVTEFVKEPKRTQHNILPPITTLKMNFFNLLFRGLSLIWGLMFFLLSLANPENKELFVLAFLASIGTSLKLIPQHLSILGTLRGLYVFSNLPPTHFSSIHSSSLYSQLLTKVKLAQFMVVNNDKRPFENSSEQFPQMILMSLALLQLGFCALFGPKMNEVLVNWCWLAVMGLLGWLAWQQMSLQGMVGFGDLTANLTETFADVYLKAVDFFQLKVNQ